MNARRALAPLLAAGVLAALICAIAGGLLRAGIAIRAPGDVLARAALSHAALMIGVFFGTVIAIERAVAARTAAAWVGPFASAAAGGCIMAGFDPGAQGLLVVAGLAFVAVNVRVFLRQRAAHTLLLVAGAVAWLAGNTLFALHGTADAVAGAWFTFLVVTIAAERLEMTRLMRRRAAAQPLLFAIVAAMAVGALASRVLWGASVVALALWLLAFDVARRTVRVAGLPRFMAVCLLAGYGWLAVGGIAWVAMALGWPLRDAALHAIGLGFVFSMVMGHAPVILPAVVQVQPRFGWPFYLPVALLHASLAWRLIAVRPGALANAGAIALFAACVAVSVIAARAPPARSRPSPVPSA